jgi:3-hydroxybutyryl-CoA dehydrogenase
MQTNLRHVGVVGAGVMGRGLAQDLAQTGHRVILLDVSDMVLEQARAEIAKNVRFHHLVANTGERFDPAAVLERIVFSTDYTSLEAVEFVIENAPEDWATKARVYAELDNICPGTTVFAANTSAIRIARIASATTRPDRVVGMHFMNPVPLKPAVEVIRPPSTSKDTMDAVHRLLAQMNKRAIVVADSPGFVSNRVLMLTVNESIFLVQERVASPAEIDDIFRSCFGHAMGPLETADLIGLDTILHSVEVLHEELGGSKFEPCPLLREMVDEGALGRKSGHGFYDYSNGSGPQGGDG